VLATCLCLVTRGAAGPDGAGQDRPGRPGRPAEVLLGFKKAGFGAGKWVGLGGKVEPGESLAQAAAREVAEESGLVVAPADLAHLATLTFRFPSRPAWDQTADVFVTGRFSGVAAESAEVAPRWFATGALPYDRMWDDARYWLPRVLAGRRVVALVTFAADCATVAAIEPAPPAAG